MLLSPKLVCPGPRVTPWWQFLLRKRVVELQTPPSKTELQKKGDSQPFRTTSRPQEADAPGCLRLAAVLTKQPFSPPEETSRDRPVTAL